MLKTADKLSTTIRIKTSDSVSWPAYLAINDLTPQHSSTLSLHIDTLLIFYILSFFLVLYMLILHILSVAIKIIPTWMCLHLLFVLPTILFPLDNYIHISGSLSFRSQRSSEYSLSKVISFHPGTIPILSFFHCNFHYLKYVSFNLLCIVSVQ